MSNKRVKVFSSRSLARRLLLASTIIVIAFFSISSFYFAESYRIQPYNTYKETFKLVDFQAKTTYNISVKPSIIYDYATIIDAPMTYLSLANSVQYETRINWVLYNNTKKGIISNATYFLESDMTITTPAWSKKFPSTPRIVNGDGNLVVNDTIVLKDLLNLVKTIDSEVQSASRRYDVNISIRQVITALYSNGEKKQYVFDPYILLSVNELNNILIITTGESSNTYTENNEKILENKINLPTGTSVSVAEVRTLTLYTTILLGTTMIGLVFLTIKIYGFSTKKTMIGFKKRVIAGRIDESKFKLVFIDDPSSFNAISRKYDSPIIHNPEIKRYYLVINDTAYVYNEITKQNPNEE